MITFVRAARIFRGAMPWRRRMPDHTARTPASAVGVSKPATWWATLIDASRRRIVEGFRVSASAVRYSATVAGIAGSDSTGGACSAHQVRKSAKSLS